MKSDKSVGSFLDGNRQPILYSFGLDKPVGFETNKNSKILFDNKTIKSVFTENTFYFEADDGRRVDFKGETLTSFYS